MKLHVLGDPVLCSTLPGKAQWHHPCKPNPARPGQIRPDACLRSRRPLAPTVEDSPEACFQAQAAVTLLELCEEVEGVAEGRETISSSTSMSKAGDVKGSSNKLPYWFGYLDQWSPTGSDYAPQGLSGNVWSSFWLSQLRGRCYQA